MEITVKDALIAEIEKFKTESLKSHIVQVWAESYKNSNAFDYIILEKENNKLWWMKVQAHQLWELWQAAKAQAIPEGFVLVPKSEIGHYYYDESEGMYIDEPDHFLTDLDIGEAQEVKCRDYFDLPSKYAAKAWDEDNQDVGTWEFFNTETEANNVAAHCKAMIEAQGEK